MSAILTEDAPALAEGSAPFQWLVKRCMHKDPDHRYASTHDLARELRNIRDHLTGSIELRAEAIEVPIAPTQAVIERQWLRPALWMLAVALAGTVGYLAARWFGGPGISRWQESRLTPFSTDASLETFPAWSPNGRSLAYSLEVNDTFQIAVRSSGATMAVQLTQSKSDCFFPFWSPDGARVYFISEQSLWSVGATGGTPEKVLDNAAQGAISPDGNTLAVLRAEKGSSYSLWIGPVRGLRLTRYTSGPFDTLRVLPWSYLRFFPDGTKLGAWLSIANGSSEFWSIPLQSGEPKRELRDIETLPPAREFAWVPGANQIVYSDSHLWRADLKTGRSVQITNGTGKELSPSVAASGRELAFSSASANYDVVRVTLDGRMEDVISSPMSEVWPARSSHGQFAYATDRSGTPEILIREKGGPSERLLGIGAFLRRGFDLLLFGCGILTRWQAYRVPARWRQARRNLGFDHHGGSSSAAG